MPFFNQNVSIDIVKEVINNSGDPIQFSLNINHAIYNGMLIFLLLVALMIILFIKNYYRSKDWLLSLMYSSGVVAIISMVFRGVYVYYNGAFAGMLYEWQMWIFPIFAILITAIIKMNENP